MGNGTGSIINTLRTLLERAGENHSWATLCASTHSFETNIRIPQQQCFILIEILQTGLVDELRRAGFQHEHLHDEWAQILSAKKWEFTQIWSGMHYPLGSSIAQRFFVERTQGPLSNRPSETISLEDYLGPATQSAIEWANRFEAFIAMMSSLYLIISLLIILTLSTLIATEIHLHIKKMGTLRKKIAQWEHKPIPKSRLNIRLEELRGFREEPHRQYDRKPG